MNPEAMEELIRRHNRLMEDMRRAICEGVLSKQDKDYISAQTKEFREYINQRGIFTTEEEQILNKIETTYSLIMRIEKDYLNQYINYLHKK